MIKLDILLATWMVIYYANYYVYIPTYYFSLQDPRFGARVIWGLYIRYCYYDIFSNLLGFWIYFIGNAELCRE
jgi:hypothetical protein